MEDGCRSVWYGTLKWYGTLLLYGIIPYHTKALVVHSGFSPNPLLLTVKSNKFLDVFKKLINSYKFVFGTNPSTQVHSPLEPNDHPEFDNY